MESLTSLRNQLQQKEKEIEERKKAAKEKAFEDGCWEGMTDTQRETWREHFELMYDDDEEAKKLDIVRCPLDSGAGARMAFPRERVPSIDRQSCISSDRPTPTFETRARTGTGTERRRRRRR